METLDGRVLGQHQGLMFYTIGQRQGLGIGGRPGADEAPWFVADKDLARNTLILVQGHDHPALRYRGLEASQLSWVAGAPPSPLPLVCQARIRHRQALQDCLLTEFDGDRCRVTFAEPQWAVAPGQSLVLYRGQECLGGGIIDTGQH
jgi:tRNA-specific 2-thiouridylase